MSTSAWRQNGRSRTARWPLQQAKSQFSELVRRAQTHGPQHVTVHGRDSVVVMSEEEYTKLMGERSGKLLVELLGASPLKDVEFDHARICGPVRDVDL